MFSAFQTFGRLGLAGGLPFSERALWPQSASSPGLWIDPSYTASEFQNSAGTTPLSTVGTVLDSSNPVGLMLDRKGGLALGPELVTNGDFSNGTTGWTPNAATLAVASGELSVTATATQSGASTPISTIVGKTYLVAGAMRAGAGNVVAASCRVRVSTLSIGGGIAHTQAVSANGLQTAFSFVFVATETTHFIQANCASLLAWGSAGDIAYFDSISVREIPGLHLSQSTSAAQPVASARKNLLVGTATLSTQNVTVTAIPHTITFSGGGTVTASGTYSGALTSGQTFTPTAGTLTLTVSGSVTSAQLERGSAATSYQAVVSDSSYTATGFPQYLKFDGVDDALSSATFSAGTLTSSMDCLIAVRRDSANLVIAGLYVSTGASPYFGVCDASGGLCFDGVGTPIVFVDGAQLTGGTAVTRTTLNTAMTPGAWHIMEFRGLDMSAWTAASFGLGFGGYYLNGALGAIQLFASGQDANRDKARARMAAYFGVTLP